MKLYRDLKIASLIEVELSKILLRNFFIEGALLTIVDVKVDKDLLHARVKVAIIPYEKELVGFLQLQAERENFQRQLAKKIKIKPLPKIIFELEEKDKHGQVAKR
jgi:ribosome-binding factor A